jgi:hypothetical protein
MILTLRLFPYCEVIMSRIKEGAAIRSVVNVRQNSLRSVNIELDLSSKYLAESYVLTAQARSSLARILSQFEGQTPTRSWTLTGPYGSGKSYFGLFLMNLLGKTQPGHAQVVKQLQQVDPSLTTRARQALNHGSTQGLLSVPITGSRSSLQDCIKRGLMQVVRRLDGDGKTKPLLAEMEKWPADTDSRVITRWLKRFLDVIRQPKFGYLGMLLVFDELGKPLEFAAAHSDATDIYLLQEMAEFANRSADTPFVFVGILHQAFEHYAHLLDIKTQREWSKVQGRYEDIAFQESPNQQIRLLANTIEYVDQKQIKTVLPALKQSAQEAADAGWCPPMMKSGEFVELAQRTYPLHPAALIALPYVFRRLAQNERSIFAYLASHEPAGFQEFIELNKIGAFIRLPELFDYLSANFQGRLYATGRARAITETIERLHTVTNLSASETDLLKTIGMLNWLAEISHLQPNEASILSAARSPDWADKQIRKVLHDLQGRSLVVYRRFNKTYSVWRGSDVDIEERLQKARQQLGGAFSLAETVQKYIQPRPIVARRHSYQKGTLRYFDVVYVDSFSRGQLSLEPTQGANGKVVLCLPRNYAEIEEFSEWAKSKAVRQHSNVVVGIAERIGRLTDLLYELRCLHWVRENTPELRDDPVAQRELRTRLTAIESQVQNDLDRLLSPYRLAEAIGCRWLRCGKEVLAKSHQGLSHLLSEICDELYPKSPVLWNEIINRRALSSQGAAARRNLIEAMLTHAAEENLGIQRFPPERSMYDSLLKASGLHRQRDDGRWGFSPLPDEDSRHLRAAWDAMSDYIFTDTPEHHVVEAMFKMLNLPPFGMTDGVLPIFLCAFLIIHQAETTLYREGTLLPEPGVADWEVLIRRPELFQVAGCRVTGTRQAIVERFARGLRVEPMVMPVVRALVPWIRSLPDHTRRTSRVSKQALAVRAAIDQARSPELLLFNDLPIAVEMEPFESKRLITEQVETFFTRLNLALEELSNEMARLLVWGRDQLLVACGMDAGEDGWNGFRSVAAEMATRVTQPSLLPLLKRAAEDDAKISLEKALAFVASRTPDTWLDVDADRFSVEVQTLGKQFRAELARTTPDTRLTPEDRRRSRSIAVDLHHYLEKEYSGDTQVIKAALQLLLEEYYRNLDA